MSGLAVSQDSNTVLNSIRERITSAVPAGWQATTLGECFRWSSGGTPRRTEPAYFGGSIPWTIIGDLNDGVVTNTEGSITEAGLANSAAKWVEPGSVMVAMYGSIGKLGIAGCRLTTNQAIAFTNPDPVDSKYLYYFLLWQRPSLARLGKGATQLNISQAVLKEFPFLLAPQAEQRRIVAEIEKQFSRLDEAVAGLQRVKANLKRYKAAVLKSAVAGRLVPTEAELARRAGRNYETGAQLLQRILETRRSQWRGKGKYKESAAPDTTGLPELPEGWVWSSPDTLAAPVAESIGAGPFGTIFKAKDFRSSGVPIIFLRHVAPGRYLTHKAGFMDRAKWEELFVPYSVFGGELLVTKLGEPPGACAIYPRGIGPAMVTPDVIKMATDENLVAPEFLMNYFNSEIARRFSTGVAFGTTRLRLTLPIFRSMPVPLPPLPEQHRIVAEVDRLLSIAREAEAEVDANLKRAQGLRQAILGKAFTPTE